MSSVSWQYLIAGFLLLHGIGHSAGFWLVNNASHINDRLGKVRAMALEAVLWTIALIGFVIAGFSVLGIGLSSALWPDLAIAASLVSVTVMILFGRISLFGALAADLAIIIAIVWLDWPSNLLIGK